MEEGLSPVNYIFGAIVMIGIFWFFISGYKSFFEGDSAKEGTAQKTSHDVVNEIGKLEELFISLEALRDRGKVLQNETGRAYSEFATAFNTAQISLYDKRLTPIDFNDALARQTRSEFETLGRMLMKEGYSQPAVVSVLSDKLTDASEAYSKQYQSTNSEATQGMQY